MNKNSKTLKLIIFAIFLACYLVLSRFLAIKTPFLAFKFSFLPLIFSAIILGPKYSSLLGFLGDLIGATLFPFGPYFLGFTISSTLSGFIYGKMLYKNGNEIFDEKEMFNRLLFSVFFVVIFINGILNTFWLQIMFDKAFWVLAPARFLKEFIVGPIEILIITIILKRISSPILKLKKFLN